MMFAFTVDRLPGLSGMQIRASRDGKVLSYAGVIELWKHEGGFVDGFVHELRCCPFAAFFFETPPLTTATLDRAFEFVLIDAPALARVSADSHAFREKLDPREQVATFRNLGGDALLVAPCDHGAGTDHAHLASFLRTADAKQIHALWKATAFALEAECGAAPRWLSSSGLGVPWLHLRIDVRPKYYSHAPYRVAGSKPTPHR
jgi:hypothetical protein